MHMIAHRIAILQWVNDHGPASCAQIIQGTGLPRSMVFPFLRTRWFANKKPYPKKKDYIGEDGQETMEYWDAYNHAHLQTPGQYYIHDEGREELVTRGILLPN